MCVRAVITVFLHEPDHLAIATLRSNLQFRLRPDLGLSILK